MKSVRTKTLLTILVAGAAMLGAAGCSSNKTNTYSQAVPRYAPGALQLTSDQKTTILAGIQKVQNDPKLPPGMKAYELSQMNAELSAAGALPTKSGYSEPPGAASGNAN